MKTVGHRNLKLLGGQACFSQGPCDLGQGIIIINLHAKFEDCGSKDSQVNVGQFFLLISQ
jgi:hypothetical protein